MNKANNWFLDKVSNKVDKSNKKLYSINLLQSSLSALIGLTESIGGLMILWKGSQLVIQNSLSLGSIVVFQSMIGNFMLPMQQLILIQDDIQNLKILTERLNDLYEIDVKVSNLPIINLEEVTNYDMKFSNTSFAYYYGKNVLENINLEIKEGSKVGIIGESGSGKTTLIKLMATLYNPSSGDIMLSHKPYNCYSISNLRSKIAYVD